MEESGELEPVHRSADSSRRCWPVSSASKWNRLALLSNSRCPREQGPIAWVTQFEVATELNTRLTVLSIDGVGAFHHVLRAAMLSKVAEVPSLRELLPFVKAA